MIMSRRFEPRESQFDTSPRIMSRVEPHQLRRTFNHGLIGMDNEAAMYRSVWDGSRRLWWRAEILKPLGEGMRRGDDI